MPAAATDARFESYRRQIRQIDKLSTAQEAKLGRAWRSGDSAAGQALILANLGAVMAIAWEYRRWGTPMDDLVQQGSIGLLKAAERYDPERDIRLRSYASYWIRAEIRDYVVRGYRAVRLGTTRTERRAVRAYRSEDIQDVDQLVERSGMPRERCQQLWPLLRQRDSSIDAPPTPGVSLALQTHDPDPEQVAIDAQQLQAIREEVQRAIAGLTPREQAIVRARMMDEQPRTLEDIGREHGVSRERIRQLEKRAKDSLRETLVRFAN